METISKIPSPENGVEIRHTVCGMCCSGIYCGVDAYIRDGNVIKVEGSAAHRLNKGLLCAKGQGARQYIYKENRVKTPMRRIGERGSNDFQSITWEEAYDEIAHRLSILKERYGAAATAFYSGYEKWYRPMLERFAYAYGTPNYASESSSCFSSLKLAWLVTAGKLGLPDKAHSGLYMGWGFNNYYSRYLDMIPIQQRKDEGMKIIVIDPRITPAVEKLADLHLQLKPGTDGALALGLGHILIRDGHVDYPFIRDHVHGFEEYREYTAQFTPEYTSAITGVPVEKIETAAKMMWDNRPISMHESVCVLTHHTNGFQNYRAMLALSALTGSYDVQGGTLPRGNTYAHQWAGFETCEKGFLDEKRPHSVVPRIGEGRFPIWDQLNNDFQMMTFQRQVMTQDPYPIKALFAFGLNHRMFPDPAGFAGALGRLDFVVDVDLFMTDSAKYADIILPACTSFEREEFKIYAGGWAMYTHPAIKPLYQSKSDVVILQELAQRMNLDDDLLKAGYRACVQYIIRNTGLNIEEMEKSDVPVKVPCFKPYVPGSYTAKGYNTPTGKFEIASTIAESLGFDALPTYKDSLDNADPEKYPLTLFTGSSMPFAIHSRLHDMPWERVHRQKATADINPQDAQERGIQTGDMIILETASGKVRVAANCTNTILRGTVSFYHAYPEADANQLISSDHLDPYSGFPGYRTIRCNFYKTED